MAGLRTEVIEAPTAGYDSEAAPVAIGKSKATLLKNMLPGRAGKAVLRGPFVSGRKLSDTGTLKRVTGFWAFDDKVLMSRSNGAAWEAWIHTIDGVNTLAPVLTTMTPDAMTGQLQRTHARVRDFVYGLSQGTTTQAIRNGLLVNFSNDSKLLRWNGSTGLVAAAANTAPVGARFVINHLNRLWVLGGSVPGTATPIYSDKLYWGIDGGPSNNALTDWKDATSGLVNQIDLGGSQNDFGVALAKLGTNLLVLRRRSLMVLSGSSPDSFAVRRVQSIGCIDPNSVVEYDDKVFFLSDDGYMAFDGATVQNVSTPISGELREAFQQTFCWGTRVGGEYIMLSSNKHPVDDPGNSTRCWLLHVPSNAWIELTSDVMDGGPAPRASFLTANFPIVWDGDRLYDASYLTLPDAAPTGSAVVKGNDYSIGGTTALALIPGEYRTRTLKLGSPAERSQLHRLLLDYRLNYDPVVAGELAEWHVTVEDGQGNVIVTSQTLAGTLEPADANRHRAVIDAFQEADEVTVHWVLARTGTANLTVFPCEIHDTAAEFQTTHQRTG